MTSYRDLGPEWKGMNWIRQEKRLAIYLRDGFCCAYCGTNLAKAKKGRCTLDHLTPRCMGGTHHASNLVTACIACNSSRGARRWTQYATEGAILRINAIRRRVLNLSLAKSILSGKVSRVEALRSL